MQCCHTHAQKRAGKAKARQGNADAPTNGCADAAHSRQGNHWLLLFAPLSRRQAAGSRTPAGPTAAPATTGRPPAPRPCTRTVSIAANRRRRRTAAPICIHHVGTSRTATAARTCMRCGHGGRGYRQDPTAEFPLPIRIGGGRRFPEATPARSPSHAQADPTARLHMRCRRVQVESVLPTLSERMRVGWHAGARRAALGDGGGGGGGGGWVGFF